MAYDAELADRLRDLLVGTPTTERRMFGGLAFLVNGHMAVAVSGKGGLMVRCAPEDAESHVAAGATRMEMRGRQMDGWLRVAADDVEGDDALAGWVDVGVGTVGTFPPK
jgi:TfoX/Sxy family transcriptional regulator of competence genes